MRPPLIPIAVPLGQPGHIYWMYDVAPDRIAALATFLAESASAYVNGKPLVATWRSYRLGPEYRKVIQEMAGNTGRRRHPAVPGHRFHSSNTRTAGRLFGFRGLGEGNVMETGTDLSSRAGEMRPLSEYESRNILES